MQLAIAYAATGFGNSGMETETVRVNRFLSVVSEEDLDQTLTITHI